MAVEWRGIERVPEAERHGRPHQLFTLWFAANLGFPAWYIGVLAVLLGLGQPDGILAVLAGSVIGSALVAGAAALGPETGVGSLPLSKRAFGRVGVRLPALLTGVSCLGWFAVNTVLGTEALADLLHWGLVPSLVVLTAVQVVLAVFGHDMIHRVERVASVLLLVLFGYMFVRTVGTPAVGAPAPWHHIPMAILTVAISASYLFSWGPYAADYSRYLPAGTRRSTVFWWAFWGSFVSTFGVMLLGVLMAVRFHVANPMGELAAATGHLAPLAYAAVILGTVTANVLNIYTGATSTLTLGVGLRRSQAAVVIGVLGGLLTWGGLRGFSGEYENFLLLLSYWVAPWLAILFWDAGRSAHPEEDEPWGIGLLAFLVGVAASIPFMSQTLWTGWVARAWGGADVAYYVGFIVAWAICWGYGRARIPDAQELSARAQ
jgi:NCS1 family nucleobase:cation symporter-1